MVGKEQKAGDLVMSLLDFAGILAEKIQQNDENSVHYFLTIVYVEDVLDKYGRELALHETSNIDPDQGSFNEATQRMDQLRLKLNELTKDEKFVRALKQKGIEFQEWADRVSSKS